MWLLRFLDRSKNLAYSNHVFDKEAIYSEAGTINIDGNTPGEYFNTEKR